ncbi:twin-arginine translocation pathway signal protein [Erythrobacter sp.]|uniref:twin-arginine translocation pathway signal protein n=1 Tax=Erythrobacter sp. TaxID=1042 RepID=UPI0025DAA272|nr:twin-arginine translocation pathway signal protein [Erythrobacter sp.]
MFRAAIFGLAYCVALTGAQAAQAQSSYPFVAEEFTVPEELVTPDFRLRMLTVNDVVRDFEAVVASTPHLSKLFPSSGGWPTGLTLEDNLIDLGWHQREFTRRRSFAYTVLSPDGAKVIGCVYINPTRKVGYDADVTFWARESFQGDPADRALEAAVRAWVATEWQFANPAFPGRDLSWEEWKAVPTTTR